MHRLVSAVLCVALVLVAGLSARGQGARVYWSDPEEEAIYSGEIGTGEYSVFQSTRNPTAYTYTGSVLYWADKVSGTIRRRSLSGDREETLITSEDKASDLAIYGDWLYWIRAGALRRVSLAGKDRETLIGSLGGAISMAIDTASSQVYWLESGSHRGILRANLDGSEVDTVVSDLGDSHDFPDFALDETNRKIYWTERGDEKSVVRRADLSGSSPETLLEADPDIVSVAVDGPSNRLYWAVEDSIWAGTLQGEDPVLIRRLPDRPSGSIVTLAYADGRLDWRKAGFFYDTVERFHLASKKVEPLVVGFGQPHGLTVDSTAGHLYWTAGQAKVLRSDLDGNNVTEVVEWPCAIGRIADVALDVGRGMTYWSSDCEWDAFFETTLEGESVRREEYINNGKPPLAIDTEREELFWVVNGRIHRSRPDSIFAGAYGDPLTKEISDPVGMAFDQHTDQLYVASMNEGTIERIRRDGTGRETIHSGLDQPRDVALDHDGNQLVWVENGSGTVWRSALDGSGKEQLFSNLTDPQYVAVAGAKAIAAPAPDDSRELPTGVKLHPNYPNPFNPSTRIAYELPRATDVRLTVFDLLGRRVRTLVDRRQAPGRHEVQFDAIDLPSGLYFYRLETASRAKTKTMLLRK